MRLPTYSDTANAMYKLAEQQCLTRCIPPKAIEGRTCRALCSDGSDQAVKDYVSVCLHDGMGEPYYEDFDMTWAASGKPMSTSRVLRIPNVS